MSTLVEGTRLPAAARHGAEATAAERPAALARLRTFHTLDALRLVAALVVVLFHAGFVFGMARPAEGQIAVDLFFCMSGFIISHRYDGDLGAGMGVRRFLATRLIRLYPLFLLGTLLGLAPSLVTMAVNGASPFHVGLLASLPSALLMLPSHLVYPESRALYPLNFVAWTLALEIAINTFYAATFAFWSLRRILAAVTVGFVALSATAMVYGTLHVGFEWPNAAGGFPRVVFGFFAGVLIQRLHRQGIVAPRLPWWLLVAGALLLLCAPAVGSRALWELGACAVVVPLIVAAAITTEPPPALRSGCALGGLFSYLVYSLHAPFIGLFLHGETLLHLDVERQTPLDAVVFTLLLLALCAGAHGLYDRPVRRVLSRRLAGTPAPEPGAGFIDAAPSGAKP